LLGVGPELALVDNRDTPAQSPERLAGATKQAARSRAHGVDNKTAIIIVQQEYETNIRLACMQTTQGIDQVIMIGVAVAQKHDIAGGRPQGLYALRQLAATAGNLHARLAAKSAAKQLGLCLIGIGHENTDGIATRAG
jgi:hypothetical protein